MFQKKQKPIAIIMDEVDGMNNGDKTGITVLIKMIRGKKTKKQKKELSTNIPVICIGNNQQDKKIRELMKVCTVIQLKPPSLIQMRTIIQLIMPKMINTLKDDMIHILSYINGDLRKLQSTYHIYKEKQQLLNKNIFLNVFQSKIDNDDKKTITRYLLNHTLAFHKHNEILCETDRTSVALLFHENIVDAIIKNSSSYTRAYTLQFYLQFLNDLNFCDYMDRITFQKQIWSLSEISSFIKNMSNNHLYHHTFKHAKPITGDIRFTKILTKYSTEYNNNIFINTLCNKLHLDKKDVFSFFIHIKKDYLEDNYIHLFEGLDITKLDVRRMYRLLSKICHS